MAAGLRSYIAGVKKRVRANLRAVVLLHGCLQQIARAKIFKKLIHQDLLHTLSGVTQTTFVPLQNLPDVTRVFM
jgi:hypothetical protein